MVWDGTKIHTNICSRPASPPSKVPVSEFIHFTISTNSLQGPLCSFDRFLADGAWNKSLAKEQQLGLELITKGVRFLLVDFLFLLLQPWLQNHVLARKSSNGAASRQQSYPDFNGLSTVSSTA
ncbi:hypothetical protein LOK49_LG05G03228 [Camellia lanceoleosa]|uniref:Uncharacterized protein n=1 Tax=Camellia lanceoleosa TaxID=1840588 RepID=A0ACC0HVN8_9ERIC|nr:hypothetical protein LOK49_LG05G03228 [Camellia lanceoleosa]